MKYDDILVDIGEFGCYQKRVYFLMTLPALLCGAQVMSVVFTMALPPYRCAIPGLDNDTFNIQSDVHRQLINLTIPAAEDVGYGPYDGCSIYDDVNVTSSILYLHGNVPGMTSSLRSSNRSSRSCSQWVYDQSEFVDTVMTEFSAYCGDTVFRSHANMLAGVGSMIGALTIGVLADVFGRKKAVMTSIFIYFGTTLGLYLSPDLLTLMVIKVLLGISTQTTFSLSITAGMELVGPNKRTFAGMMCDFYWTIGVLLCLPIAYVIREWRNIQLVLCLLSVPLFSLWWLIPESPRWLLDKKKFRETEEVLEKICRSNNTSLPLGAVDEFTGVDEGPKDAGLLQIFTSRTLIGRMLLVYFNWFAVCLLYYGLSLNVGNLGGSTYLNYLIGSLVEGLAYVVCFLLMDRLGRRRLYCGCMLLGGAACVAVIGPVEFGGEHLEWLTTALAMMGKFGVSGGYALVYIMSAELFPTVVRQSAMGSCAVLENLGSMVAPYIADLGLLTGGGQELPLLVFGLVSVVNGVTSFWLPETLGRQLPETIQDAIDFGTNNRRRHIDVQCRNDTIHQSESDSLSCPVRS